MEEAGESRGAYKVCASIKFKTGHNANTASGAFRVQTAEAGHSGNSGEISLRTGAAWQGNSGSTLVETDADREVTHERGTMHLRSRLFGHPDPHAVAWGSHVLSPL